jgi:hypothetical protein
LEETAKAGKAGSDRMTPKALFLLQKAARAELERLDLLAFIAAQYTAVALLAPKRFPARPCFFPVPTDEMTDDEMKARLMLMTRRKEQHDP